VDNKGKLWLTTGVTRAGKLYYNVEEIGYATCSMKCLNNAAWSFALYNAACP
jgi:tRNA-splicing endonuclease subunit Sen54